MKELGIYVHIPFCKKKCKYCDFTSFCSNDEIMKHYFNALEKEIERFKVDDEFFNKYKITTIYFGGGTPSFPDSKYIVDVMDVLKKKFRLDLGLENANDVEVTIEVNPGTVDRSKFIEYKLCGFNRVSIGLQSANDRLLELIGRIHTYNDFIEAYNLALSTNFTNINVDLMLALPTQSEDDMIYSLKKVIELHPSHISIYSLIVEEGTELYRLVQNGKVELLSERIEREMYWDTKKLLEINGYKHYEISNFAREGKESRHNMNCWNQEEYLGFGLAAHSYYRGSRYSNTINLDKYINSITDGNYKDIVIINENQDTILSKAKEYMMLGLRKIDGVSISRFEEKFGLNPLNYFKKEIDKLVSFELVEYDDETIKLTHKGIDLANIVFEEFV